MVAVDSYPLAKFIELFQIYMNHPVRFILIVTWQQSCRFPLFFDDMCLRALPVIPLIIYRLIENDATETAERLLAAYHPLIFYHPSRFSFVRDTLSYFYGHLPTKLVLRLLSSMDLPKVCTTFPYKCSLCSNVALINEVVKGDDSLKNLLIY
jgi:hypothetical protein